MKKILAVIGAALCVLCSAGCVDTCAGAAMGGSILFCGAACNACTAGSYPFMHECDSFDDVHIDRVELTGSVFGSMSPEEVREVMLPVAQITDKEGFMKEFLLLRSVRPLGDPYWVLYGKAICLTYPDGQFELITEGACALVSDEINIVDRNFLDERFEPFWDK